MGKQRIAVIGAVASGTAAAAQAKRTNPEADVVLFEQGSVISYGACEMPYYLSGQIEPLDRLIINTPQQFEDTRGVRVLVNHAITKISLSDSRLTVEDRTDSRQWEERFDKCILATGATARRLEVEGQDAENVFTFRELMDADAVRKAVELRDVKHAVVVGGGYVGVEVAEALTRQGIRTTILDRNGQVLQKYLSGDLNQQVADELLTHGVTVRQDSVEKIVSDDSGKVASLWTKSGERIGCQLIIVAIGVVPNTSLADKAGIRVGKTGGVKVDAAMRTSSPRIWACGDCIEVERIVDKKAIPSTLATTAYRTARVAGHNAARQGVGKPQVFDGVSPASAVKVFNLEVATAGLSLQDATASGFDAISSVIQSWSRVKMYPGAEKIFVDMIVEKRSGRLLGVQMVGREGVVQRCNVLIAPIREGWSVSKVKNIDMIYAPPFGPSLDPVIVAARESEKRAIV